jgi:hypothetical protein
MSSMCCVTVDDTTLAAESLNTYRNALMIGQRSGLLLLVLQKLNLSL